MKLSSISNLDKYIHDRKININKSTILNTREIYIKLQHDYDKLRHIQKKIHNTTQGTIIKNQIKILKESLHVAKDNWNAILNILPAELHHTVTEDNVIIRKSDVKERKFQIPHNKIKWSHPQTPFGFRLPVFEKNIVQLERALISWVMDRLEQHKFQEYGIPTLIKSSLLQAAGHLPKEENGMYAIPKDDMYLSPTGEVGLLCWLTRNNKYTSDQLICTVNNCYRRESGAAGKKDLGFLRVHEFRKCEMVALTSASKSYALLEKMLSISENIIKSLELPYRIVQLGYDDVGHHASKTYDIEVKISGQWKEVASISNCEDFQAYKLGLKYQDEVAHTLNGTALALPRILSAISEHYQCHIDGMLKIKIPNVLKEYLPNKEYINI